MKKNQPRKLTLEHPVSLDKLEALNNFLKQHGTFDIKPRSSGLFRAVWQKSPKLSRSSDIQIAYDCGDLYNHSMFLAQKCGLYHYQ